MLTKEEAYVFAEHWLSAWNAHDLDRIMEHYEDQVELSSPVAIQLLNDPEGRVVGKANLRAYFQKGLTAFPQLHFNLIDVLWGRALCSIMKTNVGRIRPNTWSFPHRGR